MENEELLEQISDIQKLCNEHLDLKNQNSLLFTAFIKDSFVQFTEKYPFLINFLIENEFEEDSPKLNEIVNLVKRMHNNELSQKEATDLFQKLRV